MDERELLCIIRYLPGMTGLEMVDNGLLKYSDATLLQRLEKEHKIMYYKGWYVVPTKEDTNEGD